jgi:ribose-phosphate pyrophosphokinase
VRAVRARRSALPVLDEAVIVDVMLYTGATIEAALVALREAGCSGKLTVAASHAVLTVGAPKRQERLALGRLVMTDRSGWRCAGWS